MKNLIIAFFAILFVNVTIAQSSKTFNLDSFTAISITNSSNVVFRQGPQSVSVSGSQELIDKLDVSIERNSLKIKNKKGKSGNWYGKKGLTFQISTPNLKGLVISGSGDFVFDNNLKGSDFSMVISGSGDVSSKGSMDVEKLSIVISGSGDVNLSGSANKQSLALSGSGDVNTEKLKCAEASVVNSGSADIEIYASEKISIVNSGSGDVEVKGSPSKKSIVNTGSGDIDYK